MGSAITSLVLHYGKHGDPLSMWMEEDGLVSKADIPTQDVKGQLISKGLYDAIVLTKKPTIFF